MDNLFNDDDNFDTPVFDIETDSDESRDVDALTPEDLSPRSTPDFFGHAILEQALLSDFAGRRMPHAIVLAGPSGVGKATLAYRLARFLFVQDQKISEGAGLFGGDEVPVQSMHVSPEHAVYKRVASGGHADLLTIEREFDDKKGRYKNDISIDAVRRIPGFLRKTAAEGGWRVVIIDGAEYITPYNQNVLLKILEEPPRKTVLIVTTSQPGLLLPTIRSRCRVLRMEALPQNVMNNLLDRKIPALSSEQRALLLQLAEGSIGAALHYHKNNGLALYKDILRLLAGVPALDVQAVHDFADKVSKTGAEQSYETVRELLISICEKQARATMRGGATDIAELNNMRMQYAASHFFNVWEKISEHFHQTDIYNLDKRQAIISAFLMIQKPEFASLNVKG